MIITTNSKQIETVILKEFVKFLNDKIKKEIPTIEKYIKTEIMSALTSSNVFTGLISGGLGGEFGIPSGEEVKRYFAIAKTIADNMRIEFKRLILNGNTISGGLRILIQPTHYADILSLPDAVVVDNKNTLDWLEWLLTKGDQIVVSDFEIKYGNYPFSRSGDAIMIEKIGSFWKVPSDVSGTETDNFITRAFSNLEQAIFSIIRNALQ